MTEETTSPPRSLRTAASRAFGWSFLNTAVSRFGTLAIGIVLARVLGPEEFGTYAVATVAMMAVLSFNELGVSLAIVRWQGDPRHIAPTVNTISVFSSAVLVGAMVLTARPFAEAMGDASATPVVQLMSVAILINGAVAVPAALMQREFQQGRRMVIDQVNTWLGAGLSLVLALTGLGAMSLAVGRIAGAAVSGALFVWWSPLPYRFGLDRTQTGALLRFGLPLAGTSMIVFAGGYADQLVTGSQLGATALGFYVLAFNLSSWPVSIFSQPLRSVAPAAFARLQHDQDQMNNAFQTILGLLAAITFPACALLAGAAMPIVRFVYGSGWEQSAPVLAWLGILAAVRIVFELSYDFLVVRGRSKAILVSQVIWVAVSIPSLLIGSRWGISGVALAQVAVSVLIMVPLYAVLLRGCGLRLVPLARRVIIPIAVAGLVLLAARLFDAAIPNAFLACLASGLVGLVAMAGLAALRRRDIAAAGLLRKREVPAA